MALRQSLFPVCFYIFIDLFYFKEFISISSPADLPGNIPTWKLSIGLGQSHSLQRGPTWSRPLQLPWLWNVLCHLTWRLGQVYTASQKHPVSQAWIRNSRALLGSSAPCVGIVLVMIRSLSHSSWLKPGVEAGPRADGGWFLSALWGCFWKDELCHLMHGWACTSSFIPCSHFKNSLTI